MKNYYDILEIDPSTPYGNEGKKIIKQSFRKLALQYHPDKNEESESSKFNDINEAYENLYDEAKRREYDSLTGFNPSVPKSGPRFGNPFLNPFNFKSNFTFTRRVEIPIQVTLHDIFYGKKITKNVDYDGKHYSFDIDILPKQIMTYNESIDEQNGTTIISFVPHVSNETKDISSNAEQIVIDNKLNLNLIFKIPFEMALTGGSHITNFFKEKIQTDIPKCCPYGYTVNKDNLNLSLGSKTDIIYFYDLPKFSDQQISQILEIIHT